MLQRMEYSQILTLDGYHMSLLASDNYDKEYNDFMVEDTKRKLVEEIAKALIENGLVEIKEEYIEQSPFCPYKKITASMKFDDLRREWE